MTKKIDGRGPAFTTGGLRKPREDLVEWPPDSSVARGDPGTPPMPLIAEKPEDGEGPYAELARAKAEIRRLLTRIQELSEENERLRRAMRASRPDT